MQNTQNVETTTISTSPANFPDAIDLKQQQQQSIAIATAIKQAHDNTNNDQAQAHEEQNQQQQEQEAAAAAEEEAAQQADKAQTHKEKEDQHEQHKPNFSFSASYPYAPGRPQAYNFYPSAVVGGGGNGTTFSLLSHIGVESDDYEDDYAAPLPRFGVEKPNAIVRPIRRTEQLPPTAAGTTQLTRYAHPLHVHNVSLDTPALDEQNAHGAAAAVGAAAGGGVAAGGVAANAQRSFFARSVQEVRTFAEQLHHKLRYLQPEESYGGQHWSRSKNSNLQDHLSQRPRFVTTVPTGIFLPPAKELEHIPASMLRRHIYAYSSYPIILSNHYNTNYYNNNNNNGNNNNHNSSSNSRHTMAKDKARQQQYGDDLTYSDGSQIRGYDKDFKISATRINGIRQSAIPLASKPANMSSLSSSSPPPLATPSTSTTLSSAASQVTVVAGEVPITKEQFRQQLQERRETRKVIPPMEPYKNVMYEKRVIKGSNFGNQAMIADVDPFDKAAELRRRNMLRKRSIQCRNQRNVLGTPPPVKGRKHEDVQTEKYLEKLVQRPPEFNAETQTDLFLEKPPIPPYVPAKIGIDVATEIGDGELFHFDAEAQPIIDVLVDACIEQSMLEVAHEMELDELRRKQEEYLAQREAELAELRRLEAEELRLQAEKERRLRQDTIAKELDQEMQKSVTAAKLLQGHIASLVPEVLQNIEPASDAVKKEQLIKNVCPWLSAEVAEEVGHIVDSREILTAIIKEIITQRAEIYAGYKGELSEAGTLILDVCEEEDCDAEQNIECCPCETETDYEECPRAPTPPDAEQKIASLHSPPKNK